MGQVQQTADSASAQVSFLGISYIPSGQRRSVHGSYKPNRTNRSRFHHHHHLTVQGSNVARVLRYKRPCVRYCERGNKKISYSSILPFRILIVLIVCSQRASQIRSSPFTGDSSDDSSDGEGEHTNTANTHSIATRITNSSSTDNTDTSLSSSSPSKSHKTASTFSPVKHNSSGSPSKSMYYYYNIVVLPQIINVILNIFCVVKNINLKYGWL